MTLKSLGDVQELLGHLPKEHRAKDTWQHVSKTLELRAMFDVGYFPPNTPPNM